MPLNATGRDRFGNDETNRPDHPLFDRIQCVREFGIEMRADRPSEDQDGNRAGGLLDLSLRDGVWRQKTSPSLQPGADNFQGQLDLSVAEVAVMWILHQRTLSSMSQRTLPRHIAEFYPVALSAMSRGAGLRGAKQADLRLVYFKGLIVAHTHPRQQIVEAIRGADHLLDHTNAPGTEVVVTSPLSDPGSGDYDTLAHIADALGSSPGASH